MDHRSLVALTTGALLLLQQLQANLLPGWRAAADPLLVLARHEAQRTAELRRLGIELAGRTPPASSRTSGARLEVTRP
jgi:hypothetical protein